MSDPVFAINETLRSRLSSLIPAGTRILRSVASSAFRTQSSLPAGLDYKAPIHAVVTANEVNHLHGTGPLVQRIFSGRRNVLSIRTRDDWGVNDFGDASVCLSPRARTRAEAFRNVLGLLKGRSVATVLCVPFLPDEFLNSIAIQECFQAKLCVYMMDDQNIAVDNIPDALMRDLLERCSLRLATHPELRFAYEAKYGLPFHLLPAIVPGNLVGAGAAAKTLPREARRGALLGSFWDQVWFDRLCAMLSKCDFAIDWFGNNKSPWLTFAPESLTNAGITAHGVLPEQELAQILAQYPFVIVPVGALDEGDLNPGVAWLSLPGRILFAAATAHTPVLIVGSERTCGARFVSHFGVGEVVPYDADQVAAAMERLSRPENQRRIRQNAARIAPFLSDEGVSEWLSKSVEQGAPADRRFEDLFAGYDGKISI